MTKPLLQNLQKELNSLKNEIINFLLPLANKASETKTPTTPTATPESPKPRPRRRHVLSYSDAVRKQTHSTIIVNTPKNPQTNGTTTSAPEIINRITEHISNSSNSATIQKTATPSDEKIIIKLSKNDNVGAIASELRSELGLDARGRSPFLPKMTISHIPAHVNLKTNIKDTILQENTFLQGPLKQGTFEVLFTYKAKDFGSAVIKVSANVRNAITDNGTTLKIGSRACPVRDRLQPMRCTKCCSYGHTRKQCRADSPICHYCAEKHETSTCPNKEDTDKRRCHNCCLRKASSHNHSAFDTACPTLKVETQKLFKNTDYGYGQAPTCNHI